MWKCLLGEFGGAKGLKVSGLICIKSGFSRMNQWGFVKGEVVRERNFDVRIPNLQKP